MATWTAPKTWADGNLVDEDDLNTHLRDNLIALKEPPTDHYEPDEASDYTTTSTSFVDVDSTNLRLDITTTGGDVLVGFDGVVQNSTGNVRFEVDIDGSPLAGDEGIVKCNPGSDMHVSFVRLVTDLSSGSHTFKLQWRVGSGSTGKLYAGAGSVGSDNHPQFWVREAS